MSSKSWPPKAEDLVRNAFVITTHSGEAKFLVDIFNYFMGVAPRNIMVYPVRSGMSGIANLILNWRALIMKAIEEKLPWITIFESDAYPRCDALTAMDDISALVPQDADVVYWGSTILRRPYGNFNNVFLSAKDICGAHSLTIFSKAYERLLRILQDLSVPVDLACSRLKAFACKTNIFVQYNAIQSRISKLKGYHSSTEGWRKNYPPAGFAEPPNELCAKNPGVGNGVYDSVEKGRHVDDVMRLLDSTNEFGLTVVEVGSHAGAMTKVFASHPRVKKVFAIDYWQSMPGLKYGLEDFDLEEAERQMDVVVAESAGKVVKFKGSLEDFLQEYHNLGIDLVYLDGYHDLKEVVMQIREAKKHGVRFICGHDYLWGGAQVAIAVGKELGGPSIVFPDSSWMVDMTRISMDLEEMISHSFCLSCSEQEWNAFSDQFDRCGFEMKPRPLDGRLISFNPEFERFPHRSWIGCTLGHRYCVAFAKAMGWDYVTVFESDALPSRDCAEVLSGILDKGIPLCAGMVVWGTNFFVDNWNKFIYDGTEKIGLHNGNKLHGSQAVTYFRHYYDTYLKDTCNPTDSFFCSDSYDRLDNVWVSRSALFIQSRNGRLEHPRLLVDRNVANKHFDIPNEHKTFEPLRKSPKDRSSLLELISWTQSRGLRMIELGSFAGESADIFASCDAVSNIQCIDAWNGVLDVDMGEWDMTKAEDMFDEVVKKHQGKITKYKGTVEMFLMDNPDVRPALWYIDAAHDYRTVKYNIFAALSTQPEFISGHDYNSQHAMVMKAVDEVLGVPDKVFADSSWIKRLR